MKTIFTGTAVLSLCILTVTGLCFADDAGSGKPDILLLDFTASYCRPCQAMLPVIQRMEHDNFPIRRIDISDEPELAKQYQVRLVPTFVLVVEGKEIERFVGETDEAVLRRTMNVAARRLADRRGQNGKGVSLSEPRLVMAEASVESEAPVGDSRPTMKDMFRSLIGGGTETEPTLRGQNPDEPSGTLKGLEAASAATVRVRVAGTSTKNGAKVQDVGTGTIVYSVPGESIVLTCAHVFFDIATQNAMIEVEIFENGKPVPCRASLIGGNRDSDLALLRLETASVVPTVRLTASQPSVTKGQQLVSFGCNEGDDPTRLETRVADINRYNGPGNLVCTTDPKSGRSGGGLFTPNGQLVGVCSCADRKRQEGLYMAYGPILDLVRTLKVTSILTTPEASVAASSGTGEDAASTFAEMLAASESRTVAAESSRTLPEPKAADRDLISSQPVVEATPKQKSSPGTPVFDELMKDDDEFEPGKSGSAIAALNVSPDELSDAPLFNPEARRTNVNTRNQSSLPAKTMTAVDDAGDSGPEITIVIDDHTPGSQKKVIVIPKASPWMMELLTGETPGSVLSATSASAASRSGAVIGRKSSSAAVDSGEIQPVSTSTSSRREGIFGRQRNVAGASRL